MKKGLRGNYLDGIVGLQHGESCATITSYIVPELISAFFLYLFPLLIDAYFVSQLARTEAYATLGVSNTIIYFIYKMAESLAIGTAIIIGQYNGIGAHEQVGSAFRSILWITYVIGFIFSLGLYAGAPALLLWYGLPEPMIALGIPFLRIRSMSVFFMFVSFALIGFLRGLKNTSVAMVVSGIGVVLFCICDYQLVFGSFYMPRMELCGSAIASLLQYALMSLLLLIYIVLHGDFRHYHIRLYRSGMPIGGVRNLLSVTAPVMLDKATMAWSYMWLGKMISPMGASAVAAYCVLKDITRCAFLPAIAGCHVITFLVSNDVGSHKWDAIIANSKKVCGITAAFVGVIMIGIFIDPRTIIRLFDVRAEFTELALRALPSMSVLVFFDLVQLVLSGALRGMGSVKRVMYTRLVMCICVFIPISFICARLSIDQSLKFILVYGSFYMSNAVLGMLYMRHMRSDEWKVLSLKGPK